MAEYYGSFPATGGSGETGYDFIPGKSGLPYGKRNTDKKRIFYYVTCTASNLWNDLFYYQ